MDKLIGHIAIEPIESGWSWSVQDPAGAVHRPAKTSDDPINCMRHAVHVLSTKITEKPCHLQIFVRTSSDEVRHWAVNNEHMQQYLKCKDIHAHWYWIETGEKASPIDI